MTMMAGVVEVYGGVPMRVIGDQLMALFGAPVAHGDDAERAVRAALDLQRCAREEGETFGGLPLRVGVNSGETMFGPVGPDREFTVIGDTVNLASRLQSCAPPGGVLVGAETYRATRRSIRYRSVPWQRVKGKADRVPAYLAVEALSLAERPTAGGRVVGRVIETGVAATLWDRVLAERAPHLLTVVGPPGIGKTRLSSEVCAAVEQQGGRTLTGRSLPYGESTGYGAFARMVRASAAIFETDPAPLAEAKLKRRVSALLPLVRAEEVTSHLSVLSGLVTQTAGDKGALLLSARRFVEALSREQPTVLVFEDLHWADPTLLDLVESLAGRARDAPVLLLALARPELLDTRPGWGGGQRSSTLLELHDLSAEDSASLLAPLLPPDTDPATVAALVERAGGNPLFLEELAASLVERAGEPLDGLPANVKAIIAARLDALPGPERQLLLDASVVGKTFWSGAVRAVVGGDVDVLLDRLEARDLVRREATSRFERDEEFSFKHILIREVAYGLLPRAARRTRHAAAARFLEEATGDRVAESASLLAHHWREAGDVGQAVGYLLLAAERAAQAWAKGEAVSLYQEALELVPEADVERRRTIALRRALLLLQINEYEAGSSELDRLLPELSGRELVEATVARAYVAGIMEDSEAVESRARRAIELAEALDVKDLRGPAVAMLAFGKLLGGEVAESLALCEEAFTLWVPGSHASELSYHLGTAGNASYLFGRCGEAVDYGRRGYEIGRKIHHGEPTLWAGTQLALGLAGLGRHAEALRHAEELVTFGHQIGTVPMFTAIAGNVWAGILRDVGALEQSRRQNHEAIELATSVRFPLAVVEGHVDLVFADLAEGEIGRAEQAWPDLWEHARAMPGTHRWRNLGRLQAARAMISLEAGRLEQAADEAWRAIEDARQVGRVKYEIAGRVVLGRALLGMGGRRAGEATSHLHQAVVAAEALKHPPTWWESAAALVRALERIGDDDATQAMADRIRENVERFAAGLPEEHRRTVLAARVVQDMLTLGH